MTARESIHSLPVASISLRRKVKASRQPARPCMTGSHGLPALMVFIVPSVQLAAATLTSSGFPKHIRSVPAPGPLNLLFLLQDTFPRDLHASLSHFF